jgi:uncharacterized protein YmfQ (DUF2313 family)
MALPNFSVSDYVAALKSLLPRGRVWPRETGTVMDTALNGLAGQWARTDSDAVGLLADAFPVTSTDLLPEWEETLGLPDPCAGPAPTLQTRRAQVVARFTAQGGQSIPYFVAFAQALGVNITIQECSGFRCGISTAGQAINGPQWAFAWYVIAPVSLLSIPRPFTCGASTAGDPLISYDTNSLECEIGAKAPAHTVPIFVYR